MDLVDLIVKTELRGLRPNWNSGKMELWIDGFQENGIQSAYFYIDFPVLMQYCV